MSVDPTDHDVTDVLADWRALRKENAALREALERIITRYAVAHYKYNEGTFDFFLCRYCEHDDAAPQTAEALTHSADCPVTIARAALTAQAAQTEHRACPCLHTTPCHDCCTCVNPFSSSGCWRCCSYGNADQQRAKAEHLIAEAAQTRALVEPLVVKVAASQGGRGAIVCSTSSEVIEALERSLQGDFGSVTVTVERAALTDAPREQS